MITKDSVKKACKLSRIKVLDDEIDYFSSQVQLIMNMINEIERVDCTGIEPLVSVHEFSATMQKDEFNQTNSVDELFLNTSGSTADLSKSIKCYVVPKVIE
jgi:aspartyl-tRNA(Asn)/glutamyl-tRNA(Gln) amidotransferase subunit C